nr:unnamed protein product [Callosobruchus analis]
MLSRLKAEKLLTYYFLNFLTNFLVMSSPPYLNNKLLFRTSVHSMNKRHKHVSSHSTTSSSHASAFFFIPETQAV